MNNKLIKIIGIVLLVLIVHQLYWYNSLKGNLAIYVCNVSEKDSIKIDLFLDNEIIESETFENTPFYSFKKYPINVLPGKHEIFLKIPSDSISEKYEFYTFFIKRIVIEYQGKNNQLDGDTEFMIQSESVYRNLIIQ